MTAKSSKEKSAAERLAHKAKEEEEKRQKLLKELHLAEVKDRKIPNYFEQRRGGSVKVWNRQRRGRRPSNPKPRS